MPVVDSLRCAPGLECRAFRYAPVETTMTISTTATAPATTISPLLGRQSPVDDGKVDPYPVCNVPPHFDQESSSTPSSTGTTASPTTTASNAPLGPPTLPDTMDCVNWPCLCRRMDYR